MTFELIQTILKKDEGRSAELVAEMLQSKIHEVLESRRAELATNILEKKDDWEPEPEPRKLTKGELETDSILKTKAQKNREALVKISSAFAKKKVDESTDLEEAVKLGTQVKIHAPGKDYHGQVGHVGEIRHGAYKGAPKTYTVDYGDRKSVQLDKKNIKVHKEEKSFE